LLDNVFIDIAATHLNGNPLRLDDWLKADDFSFMHDVNGIDKNINRKTGKLDNCSVPRYTK
jgi:hypothetical protein